MQVRLLKKKKSEENKFSIQLDIETKEPNFNRKQKQIIRTQRCDWVAPTPIVWFWATPDILLRGDSPEVLLSTIPKQLRSFLARLLHCTFFNCCPIWGNGFLNQPIAIIFSLWGRDVYLLSTCIWKEFSNKYFLMYLHFNQYVLIEKKRL